MVTLPKEYKYTEKPLKFRDTAVFSEGYKLINLASKDGEPVELIDVRLYKSASGHTHYCAVWLKLDKSGWASGAGKTGGCGYDKPSVVLELALYDAGIQISGDDNCWGRGASAMVNTLKVIAETAGYNNTYLAHFHR